ncbi:MAG: DUF1127 domain-containing protein [Pseudomonadota bacterium]
MAYASNTLSHRPYGFVARLRAGMADAAEAWTRFRMYRETYDELMGLSDRELQDLGLSRASIKGVAHETVYGV